MAKVLTEDERRKPIVAKRTDQYVSDKMQLVCVGKGVVFGPASYAELYNKIMKEIAISDRAETAKESGRDHTEGACRISRV